LSEGEGQLAESLGLLISELRDQSGHDIDYRLEGAIPRYSMEVRAHLLQIAREAIMNALKHADADQVTVLLSSGREGLLLSVIDNGRGLPPGGAFRPGGRGIANLRARATLLDGELRLVSRPGGGTTVEVMVPARMGFQQ
jgi:two-component system sensor histidine kinase UhpB